MHRCIIILLGVLVAVGGSVVAMAQNSFDPLDLGSGNDQGIVGQFEPIGEQYALSPASILAQVVPATPERPAVLLIEARIAPGRHTYSLTQPPGGPTPTKIDLVRSPDFRLLGKYQSYPAPNTRVEQGPVWTGLEIQEHEGTVTWFSPIEITAGVDPQRLVIEGRVYLEVCEKGGSCIPVEKEFSATVTENSNLPQPIAQALAPLVNRDGQWSNGNYQSRSSAVKLSGQIVPGTVRPGESAQVELTATLPPGGRIYAHALRDERFGTKPVLIAISRSSGLVPQVPVTNAAVKTDDSSPQMGPMKYHEGSVTWTVRLDVPKTAPPGEYPIHGLFGYQACEYGSNGNGICELPQAVQFAGVVRVGDEASNSASPLSFSAAANYGQVAAAAAVFADSVGATSTEPTVETPPRHVDSKPVVRASDQYNLELVEVARDRGSFGYYVALAFMGGLILNLMPCVLPVIGLKVMSFVEQAHKSRAHALVLNLWYAAGIVSVFLLLGVLAVSLGLGWGGQFGSTPFNVTIAAVVFAMALSLLGVWEVPIPGFFGSGSIQAAAAQEGPLGAFLKGVVTTVLATPCTAPFMAAAIAWAVTQSVATTLVVFASLGIGMASPYLLVGVFPELLRFLPRPGAWMETFKQISGFVLLGTVVFILSFIEPPAVIPTVLLLLGIGVACWLVARTPYTAHWRSRLQAWLAAGTVVLLFVAISFGWLYRVATAAPEAAWQPFSLERLKQYAVDERRTVVVDFSADWCLNCKVLEKAVLHTRPIEQAIAQAGAVTMYADYTNYPPEIDRTLKALGANGVPVIAIFPGNAPYQPIVFRGGYTKNGLLNALQLASGRRASGSRSVAEASTVNPPVH